MKKLLLFFLVINSGIQCMESDGLLQGCVTSQQGHLTNQEALREDWKGLLTDELNKKLNEDYSFQALISRLQNKGCYPKEEDEYLTFFKDIAELASIHDVAIKDLPVCVKSNNLNLLEAQFFAGYPKIANLFMEKGCTLSDTENLEGVVKRLRNELKESLSSSRKKNLFVRQLEVACVVSKNSDLQTKTLVFSSIIRAFEENQRGYDFIQESIHKARFHVGDVSNICFYENNNMTFNMLGYSIIEGHNDLTKWLLAAKINPHKLDQKNQSVVEIVKQYDLSKNNILGALLTLEKFKNK